MVMVNWWWWIGDGDGDGDGDDENEVLDVRMQKAWGTKDWERQSGRRHWTESRWCHTILHRHWTLTIEHWALNIWYWRLKRLKSIQYGIVMYVCSEALCCKTANPCVAMNCIGRALSRFGGIGRLPLEGRGWREPEPAWKITLEDNIGKTEHCLEID